MNINTPATHCLDCMPHIGVGEVAANARRSNGMLKTLCSTSFNIQKFCVLPTVHLCVLHGSQNKQGLFLYTSLTYQVL